MIPNSTAITSTDRRLVSRLERREAGPERHERAGRLDQPDAVRVPVEERGDAQHLVRRFAWDRVERRQPEQRLVRVVAGACAASG